MKHLTRFGAAFVLLPLLAAGSVWSQERGRCIHAEVPWPIVLPDGSTHDKCVLTLCLSRNLTPVTGHHRLEVDGHTIGLFTSRIGASEEPVGLKPLVVFEKGRGGVHHLLGYAWPTGEAMTTYRLLDLRREAKRRERVARLPLLDGATSEFESVLLAARIDTGASGGYGGFIKNSN